MGSTGGPRLPRVGDHLHQLPTVTGVAVAAGEEVS